MSSFAREVIRKINEVCGSYREDCVKGVASYEVERMIIRTTIEIIEYWNPRLSYKERVEVLEYMENEYKLYI